MVERELHILIIEDSRAEAQLVRANLSQGLDSPFSFQQELCLAEGLDRLSNERFDLLFLDLNLPDSTGFDTFLKAKSAASVVPIVIITGEDDTAQAVHAIQEGAQDYIVKGQFSPESLARSAKFAIERTARLRAERQLATAAEVLALLYPASGPDLAGFDIGGAARPAEQGCGDYFDYLPLPDGTTGFVVADVSGHGIKAALFMVELRAYLRVLTRNTGSDVALILGELNQLFQRDDTQHFASMFFGKLDPDARTFTWASAGHRGYMLNSQGEVTNLDSTGPIIGLTPASTFESSAPISVNAGDILLLPTDGIHESLSPDDELFGVDRMIQVLRDCRSKPAAHILQTIYQSAVNFIEGSPQADDMTAIVIKAERDTQ